MQEGSVLKYLKLRISQSPLYFSIDQTDLIVYFVYKWFPDGKYITFNTLILKKSLY